MAPLGETAPICPRLSTYITPASRQDSTPLSAAAWRKIGVCDSTRRMPISQITWRYRRGPFWMPNHASTIVPSTIAISVR